MKATDFKPLSYAEFEATIKAINAGEKHVPALEGYTENLPENIKFQPGDIVRLKEPYPILTEKPSLYGVGIITEVPKSLKECYYDYRSSYKSWIRYGSVGESFYDDPDACNHSDGLDYGILLGPMDDERPDMFMNFYERKQLQPVTDLSDEDKAIVESWYAPYKQKQLEEQAEIDRIIQIATKASKEEPQYFLFRDENGKWGTRNREGGVHDNPIYSAEEKENGKIIFTDHYCEACTFDPAEGMEILCWCEPWWQRTFDMADFPADLNHYLWNRIKGDNIDFFDEISIDEALTLDDLTDTQRRIINDLKFTYEWEVEKDTQKCDKMEAEWFALHPNDLTNNERVTALADLVRRPDLKEKVKETLWFVNFMFIDQFGS